MPNRIIKESITTSDTINELSAEEERFFFRLITKCDDFGRFDARPAVLRAACFPLKVDDITEHDLENWLAKLAEVGLVMLYEHDGRPYLQLVTWEKHQKKRAKQSKYPDPNECTCMQLSTNENISSRETRNEKREYENTRNDYENENGEVDEVVSEWVRLFGSIGPKQFEDLNFWSQELDKPLVLEAIRITAQQRDERRITGPPFSYFVGILRGWKQNNIFSLTDLAENEIAVSPESDGIPAEFDKFWSAYPKRKGKKKAFEQWKKAIDSGADADELTLAAKNYGQVVRAEETEDRYVKNPANFLKEQLYEEFLDPGGGWKTEMIQKAEAVMKKSEYVPANILAEARWILEGRQDE